MFKEKVINLEQQLKKLFATNEIAITKKGTIVYFASLIGKRKLFDPRAVLKVDSKCKCKSCKENNVTFETFFFIDFSAKSSFRFCATLNYVVGY
jgi:hypothetical protein